MTGVTGRKYGATGGLSHLDGARKKMTPLNGPASEFSPERVPIASGERPRDGRLQGSRNGYRVEASYRKYKNRLGWNSHNTLFYLVGTAGFEPATHGLKGRCSTD